MWNAAACIAIAIIIQCACSASVKPAGEKSFQQQALEPAKRQKRHDVPRNKPRAHNRAAATHQNTLQQLPSGVRQDSVDSAESQSEWEESGVSEDAQDSGTDDDLAQSTTLSSVSDTVSHISSTHTSTVQHSQSSSSTSSVETTTAAESLYSASSKTYSTTSTSSSESVAATKPTSTESLTQPTLPPKDPEIVLETMAYYAASHAPLHVRDTTFAALGELDQILVERPDIAKFVDRSILTADAPPGVDHVHREHPPAEKVEEQVAQSEGYVVEQNIKNRLGEQFLYAGDADRRTAQNCYIVHLDSSADDALLTVITELSEHLFHATVKEKYDTPGGIRGCTLCFPNSTLPLTLLRSISGVRWVERDQLSMGVGAAPSAPLCQADTEQILDMVRSRMHAAYMGRLTSHDHRDSDGKSSDPKTLDQPTVDSNSTDCGDCAHYKPDGCCHCVSNTTADQLPIKTSSVLSKSCTFRRELALKATVAHAQSKAHTYEQEDAPWQLSRITNPHSTLSDPYRFSATGKGVTIYVIDSGLLTTHQDFGGRAKLGFSTFASGFPQDCSGHGTQVASVAAGTNVGVAKRASIVGVQILDCTGQGENSSVIAALNWIISTHKKPAVINMSVGGPKSISVDAAVSKAVARGIPVVVAAGNSGVDACQLSPSGVPASIAVGASTADNQRAPFSNYGSCVDIFAPGRQVVAAAIPSQAQHNGFALVSGTSLSAPLVSGIYALALERMPDMSPSELRKLLLGSAVSGALNERSLRGSPNLLAQVVPLDPPKDDDAVNIMFLPRGSLPVPGALTSSVSVLEIVLLSLAGVCGFVIAVLVILVLVRRRIRKQQELAIREVPSVFR